MRHYDKLDSAISERRLARGFSWKQLANVAGVSDVTLRNIRKGRSEPNPLNKRRIEDVLNWAPGTIDAILDGGDPPPVDWGVIPTRRTAHEVDDAERAGPTSFDEDMVLVPRELSDPELRRMLEKLREDLEALDRLTASRSEDGGDDGNDEPRPGRTWVPRIIKGGLAGRRSDGCRAGQETSRAVAGGW